MGNRLSANEYIFKVANFVSSLFTIHYSLFTIHHLTILSLSIQSISVYQFKSYPSREFIFPERITGICGRNGLGKTNLLDAIHYLCFTKSYFSRQDAQNVAHGEKGFRLEGNFDLNGQKEKAVCILRETGKKEFSVNGEAYGKFSSHIGRYPLVIIAPDDIQLIIGASEERRKFIDTLLSQLDPEYLRHLIDYTKILQQRNSFLRNYQENYSKDLSVLDILDAQLSASGDLIFEKRRSFMLEFLPRVKQLYNDICQRYEDVNLIYESELHRQSLTEWLKNNRQKDLMLQRTSSGIHRDDLQFQLSQQPFKNIASQGQRKSMLFALKLAELETIKKQKHLSPILLLDDVFEKLDEERITNLLTRVIEDEETQVFITDTNCKRLEEKIAGLSAGGPTIITQTLLTIINTIDFEQDLATALGAPRWHHQWLPDELKIERKVSEEVRAALREKGHALDETGSFGATQAVRRLPDGTFVGFADPRGEGAALAY